MKKILSILLVLFVFGAFSQTVNIRRTGLTLGTCAGEEYTYEAEVNGYTGSLGCLNYNWTLSNNGTIVSGSGNIITVRWTNGSGSIAVSAFTTHLSQDGGGFGGADEGSEGDSHEQSLCDSEPPLAVNKTLPVEVVPEPTGSVTARTDFTGVLCPNESAWLEAEISPGATFIGWFKGSDPAGNALNQEVNTGGSYHARISVENECKTRTISSNWIYIASPATYDHGEPLGDRTVYIGSKVSGRIEYLNSNAQIDQWWIKRGGQDWKPHELVPSTQSGNLVFNYHNEVFNEQTQFKARLKKPCGGPDEFLATITIDAVEFIPDYNSVSTINYDVNGEISKSATYFDNSGEALQSQSWNADEKMVFASEPIYDDYDRAVGQTLSAPIGRNTLGFKEDFATVDGNKLSESHWNNESPSFIDESEPNTLGHYYSNNTSGGLLPETNFPYSVSSFYNDGSGESKNTSSPGDFHHLKSGNNAVQKSLPMLANELRHYSEIRNLLIGSSINLDRVIKQVAIDANGNRLVAYVDEGGMTIATAVSGAERYQIANDFPDHKERIEFSIPRHNTRVSLGSGGRTVTIRDLSSEDPHTPIVTTTESSVTLEEGFYSLEIASGLGPIPTNFSYEVDYSSFSYNFYDNRGRLIASMTPLGTKQLFDQNGLGSINAAEELPFTTLYNYDFQGRLMSMTEPDAGTSKFKYRKDGQIRYTMDANQSPTTYSYSDYDALGRPIESGEITTNTSFYSADPDGPLVEGDKSDNITTYYDMPVSFEPFTYMGMKQELVQGAVSSTESEEVQSWYSYDDQGRVVWFLQKIKHLDKFFLIQYEYDFLGNVEKVAYQPQTLENDIKEAFWHHYTYDKNQRLIMVHTSTYPEGHAKFDPYLHATYEYYPHGPLKRIELAENLQGIDYTYTPQGWLKTINHPIRSLDPGQDGQGGEHSNFHEDIFGMTLEYFEGDFATSQSEIGSLDLDENQVPQQYNGNVRATVFGEGEQYSSEYKQSQLQNNPQTLTLNNNLSGSLTAKAKKTIRLKRGFNSNNQPVTLQISSDGSASSRITDMEEGEVYSYTYDEKYQLKDADYSSNQTNTNTYDVSIDGYDQNGNIDGIERYGDNPSSLRDDFEFVYSYDLDPSDPNYDADYVNTNRLIRVTGYIDSITYNDVGQVIGISYTDPEKTDFKILYDVTGKITSVLNKEDSSDTLVNFKYDDRGFKMMKRVSNVENWYVRDASGKVIAIYNGLADNLNNDVSPIELPIYGTTRLGMAYRNPDHYKYIYELTDHLGNVRAIATKLELQATATMEPQNATHESQFFDNTNDDSYTPHTGSRSALTNAAKQLGPSTTFRVKAGDEVNLEVFAAYDSSKSFSALPLTTGLIGSLVTGANGGVVGSEGSGFGAGVNEHINTFLAAAKGNSDEPKAYLQYVILDEQFNRQLAIDTADTYRAVSGSFDPAENNFEKLTLNLTVPEDGYIYAYIVNESDQVIHFDDFTFQVVGPRAIRKTDYYPFGAVAKVWNNPDQTQQEKYRHDYQGQYSEKDTITGWNTFELRMYDPLIGRWLQVDPERQFSSSYVGMGNNPIKGVDPSGGFTEYDIVNGKKVFRSNKGGDDIDYFNYFDGALAGQTMVLNYKNNTTIWQENQHYFKPNFTQYAEQFEKLYYTGVDMLAFENLSKPIPVPTAMLVNGAYSINNNDYTQGSTIGLFFQAFTPNRSNGDVSWFGQVSLMDDGKVISTQKLALDPNGDYIGGIDHWANIGGATFQLPESGKASILLEVYYIINFRGTHPFGRRASTTMRRTIPIYLQPLNSN